MVYRGGGSLSHPRGSLVPPQPPWMAGSLARGPSEFSLSFCFLPACLVWSVALQAPLGPPCPGHLSTAPSSRPSKPRAAYGTPVSSETIHIVRRHFQHQAGVWDLLHQRWSPIGRKLMPRGFQGLLSASSRALKVGAGGVLQPCTEWTLLLQIFLGCVSGARMWSRWSERSEFLPWILGNAGAQESLPLLAGMVLANPPHTHTHTAGVAHKSGQEAVSIAGGDMLEAKTDWCELLQKSQSPCSEQRSELPVTHPTETTKPRGHSQAC